jgi:hypothetical protein
MYRPNGAVRVDDYCHADILPAWPLSFGEQRQQRRVWTCVTPIRLGP